MSVSLFNKLAFVAAVTAFCVVVLGAYVRLSDAGLGCPDWPGCYGTMTVPQSEEAVSNAQKIYPNKPVESGKAWKEMIHRYVAGSLGLMVLALSVLAWRNKSQIKISPWLTTALLAIIGFQALLGMWTVTLLLKPVIVTSHLIGGMTTLALLVWIAHRHWGEYSATVIAKPVDRLAIRFGLLILAVQIMLGGWTSTNYAALACTDFPTCHGSLVPTMDFRDAFHLVRELGQSINGGNLPLEALIAIQWMHRVGAIITLIYLGFLTHYGVKYTPIRKWCRVLAAVLVVQVGLGISNLILHLPLVLAVAHNLGAALLLVVMVLINSKITGERV